MAFDADAVSCPGLVDHKPCVTHAHRPEEAPAHVLRDAQAGGLLHRTSEEADPQTPVVEVLPGLEEQRLRPGRLDEIPELPGWRRRPTPPRCQPTELWRPLSMRRVHRGHLVGETARVREAVADCQNLLRPDNCPILSLHLQTLRPLRHQGADWILQAENTLIHELQSGQGSEHLGNRVELQDGALAQVAPLPVGDEFPTADHCKNCSRQEP
mmetsp:Transcript_81715/g.243661  ORF Transcript_81715/g.243661 Transcript_81715/m.243661 type:complete len:212 (+) Transcript_81715:741-1376(+)